MPDENKFTAMRAAQYQILRTCGNCDFFRPTNGEWGRCAAHFYQHGRHTDKRWISVVRSGTCPHHEWNPASFDDVVGFREFIQGGSDVAE